MNWKQAVIALLCAAAVFLVGFNIGRSSANIYLSAENEILNEIVDIQTQVIEQYNLILIKVEDLLNDVLSPNIESMLEEQSNDCDRI